ncbi:siderophore biosynthesis protein IucA [Paenibacillus sp. CCS19]|uniref:IucA/IucC family protein n=1 Tax=Paenibacillus sp. CCS19 TaxID=3158387 RepID=UPI0025686E45|nr:IucA/IucC family protein [Paenibacillus cellulosilyticus]GMK37485.1 siderophore biosynthesis protein IucA [Paenibacillus cellulosilyticus]
MKTIANTFDIEQEAFTNASERVMRQTLEALLFEGILEARYEGTVCRFAGRTRHGDEVSYSCEAVKKASFGRVRIKLGSIRREGALCGDVFLLLEEVVQNQLNGPLVHTFIRELLETLAKDQQSKACEPERIPTHDLHYEALESHMRDGHRYHPAYKSRIGFSLADNLNYGPEFDQQVLLHWVAVDEQLIDTELSRGRTADEMYEMHLTTDDLLAFRRMTDNSGVPGTRYVYLPVHPWQMEHVIPTVFAAQLASREILHLGTSSHCSYRAQQSIRTLSLRSTAAPYLKLALSLVNTSTSRILAQHTVRNAPRIADWLDGILRSDSWFQQERFELLREWMGISFRYDKLSPVPFKLAYGTLGTVVRENVAVHLKPEEEAWPLNAVFYTQRSGEPFIAKAIEQHGLEAWSRALIRTLVRPIIHLLYAHGIALESHAQNIILVTENGWPTRIIVKDLHDGVRYVPELLRNPEWEPELVPEPETHRAFNRYSFLRAESASEVRDYTLDAFFFICMTDICFALESLGLEEKQFWRLCEEAITDYQQEHPQLADRYSLFDLFGEDALIEEMTKRRIYGDGELFFRAADNPLRAARGEKQ